MIESWQARRSAFNHDWLKNHYLVALDSAINAAAGKIRGRSYLRYIVRNDLPAWEAKRHEVQDIVTDFEKEMSPRILLRSWPFSDCDHTLVEILSEVSHALWLSRYPIKALVSDTLSAINEADGCYIAVLGLVSDVGADGVDLRLASGLEALRAACGRLAALLEAFPRKVLVV